MVTLKASTEDIPAPESSTVPGPLPPRRGPAVFRPPLGARPAPKVQLAAGASGEGPASRGHCCRKGSARSRRIGRRPRLETPLLPHDARGTAMKTVTLAALWYWLVVVLTAAPIAADSFYTVTPCRALDTRTTNSPIQSNTPTVLPVG